MLRRASSSLRRSANRPFSNATPPTSARRQCRCSSQAFTSHPAGPAFPSPRGPLEHRIRNAFLERPQSAGQQQQQHRAISSLAPRSNYSILPTFFSSAHPDGVAASRHQHSSFATLSHDQHDSLPVRRFLPEVVDPPSINLGTEFDDLCRALRERDTQLSWEAYIHLRDSSLSPVPSEILVSLSTLIARQPLRDDAAEIDKVCRKLLQIGRRDGFPSSPDASNFAAQSLLDSSKACILRLVHLLLLQTERALAAKTTDETTTTDLQQSLEAGLAHLDHHLEGVRGFRVDSGATVVIDAYIDAELELRERLATCFARLRDLDLAASQLMALVALARSSDSAIFLDSSPFMEVLKVGTVLVSASRVKSRDYLASPIDETAPATVGVVESLLRALRATLAADVAPPKAIVIQALKRLDSPTLRSLLPFEPAASGSARWSADAAVRFVTRWHPWENDTDGPALSRSVVDSFADMVAVVLAKRGDMAPALHIVEARCPPDAAVSDERGEHASSLQAPDLDLFVAVASVLSRRIQKVGGRRAQLDKETYAAVINDVRVVMRVYSAARRMAHDADAFADLHADVIRALSALMRIGLVRIGNSELHERRSHHTRAHLASANERAGSRELLRMYLRRLTTSILSEDPTLRGGSLTLNAHASLLGLHLKVRDYSFSKRLYQLLRVRKPMCDLWSKHEDSGALSRLALDAVSAPDRSSFGWFFIESLTASPRPHFATRLYLDWVGSGNELSADLTALYIDALLKAGMTAVAERLLRDLHEQRAVVPAFLLRTFVDKFAEAGYPDQAIEMALALTKAWKAEEPPSWRQEGGVGEGGTMDGRPAFPSEDTLIPLLEIYSIALDKASRARLGWTAERRASLFKLFDEFRLGLGLLLRQHKSTQQRQARSEAVGPSTISIRYVRDTYNAAIRTHLEQHGDVLESKDPFDAMPNRLDHSRKVENQRSALDVSRQQIARLIDEMTEMSIEPSSSTWGMLVLSELATVEGRRPTRKQLLRAVRTFEQGIAASFLTHGPLGAEVSGGSDGAADRGEPQLPFYPTRKRQVKAERRDVHLRSEVVARLVIVLAREGQYQLAHSVHSIWTNRQTTMFGKRDWDNGVEGARIYLLAAQGKRDEWKREFVKLTQTGYTPKANFVRRLEAVDAARHGGESA